MRLVRFIKPLTVFTVFLMVFLFVFSGDANAQSCGLNVDPTNPLGYASPASISGTQWVRVEFKSCTLEDSELFQQSLDDYRRVIDTYTGAGINVLLILDYLTYPEARTNVDKFAERAGIIASEYSGYGGSVAYQIWNEPDIFLGGNMSASEYAALLSAAAAEIKAANSGAILVSGSSASGDPGWVAGVASLSSWNLVDYNAIHPYGKEVDEGGPGCAMGSTGPLGPSLQAYSDAGFGKPIWITEIGYNTNDQALQAQYLECFYQAVRNNYSHLVDHITWFAWSDGMVPPMGIVTSATTPKLSHASYFSPNGCVASSPGAPSNLPAIEFQIDEGQGCSAGGTGGDGVVLYQGHVRTTDITLSDEGRQLAGAPITGAAVCAYEGKLTTDLGNEYGYVDLIASTPTDNEGYYELLVNYANAHDNSVFLMAWCNQSYREAQKVSVDLPVGPDKDLYLHCNSNYYSAPPDCPPQVHLTGLGQTPSLYAAGGGAAGGGAVGTTAGGGATDPFYACEAGIRYGADTFGATEVCPGCTNPIELYKPDHDDSWLGNALDVLGLVPKSIELSRVRLEGNADITNLSGQGGWASTFSTLAGVYHYRNVGRLGEGQEVNELLPELYDICFANETLGQPSEVFDINGGEVPLSNTSGANSHISYSLGATLATPYFDSWAQLYRQADPEMEVAKIGDKLVYLCEIEPPVEIAAGAGVVHDCGHKYDSGCFPYLALLGNRHTGQHTVSIYNSLLDTPIPKDIEESSRQHLFPYPPEYGEEPPFQTWSFTFIPGGTLQHAVEPALTMVGQGAYDRGLSGPLGAVLHDEFSGPFGFDPEEGYNPDLAYVEITEEDVYHDNLAYVGLTGKGAYAATTSYAATDAPLEVPTVDIAFTKIGRGDYQYGVPDKLCSKNYTFQDGAAGDPLPYYDEYNEDDLTVNRYRYDNEITIVNRVTDWLFNKEDTEEDKYTWAVQAPLDAEYGGCTADGCHDPSVPVDNTCTPTEVIESCTVVGPGCDSGCPCSDFVGGDRFCSGCTTSPCTKNVPPGYVTTCIFSEGWDTEGYGSDGSSACIGDVKTNYANSLYTPLDSNFEKQTAAASKEAQTMFRTPYSDPIRVTEGFAAVDEGVQWEYPQDKATQGANKQGPGGQGEINLLRLQISDYPTWNERPTPEFVGQLPPIGPGGASGLAGMGDGQLGNTCQDEDPPPPPLDPPWESPTPLPATGFTTHYAPGVMEQVYNNRIAWGDITAGKCGDSYGDCLGYAAMLRKGDLDRCVNIVYEGNTYGPIWVIDMGQEVHSECLDYRGWVIEFDYEFHSTLGTPGSGLNNVTVLPNPNCE